MQPTHQLVSTMQRRILELKQQQQQQPLRHAYFARRINSAERLLAKYLTLTAE